MLPNENYVITVYEAIICRGSNLLYATKKQQTDVWIINLDLFICLLFFNRNNYRNIDIKFIKYKEIADFRNMEVLLFIDLSKFLPNFLTF